MSLPTPNLDDRRFQDLVDDAKRHECSSSGRSGRAGRTTTSHDPGVTLIETVASMVDQLLYRLNRVPDRTYVKFLELIGLQLQPPTAAVAPITFWLSAPQTTDVIVPAGTEVSTERADTSEPVVFRTSARLDIVATSLAAVASAPAPTRGAEPAASDLTDPLHAGARGDAVLGQACGRRLLLRRAVGSGAELRRQPALRRQGLGYRHRARPAPIEWHAWDGAEWRPCEVEQGHDRWLQPSRRRRPARARRASGVDRRPSTSGMGALRVTTAGRQRQGVRHVAPGQSHRRLHRRRHDRRSPRRGDPRRDARDRRGGGRAAAGARPLPGRAVAGAGDPRGAHRRATGPWPTAARPGSRSGRGSTASPNTGLTSGSSPSSRQPAQCVCHPRSRNPTGTVRALRRDPTGRRGPAPALVPNRRRPARQRRQGRDAQSADSSLPLIASVREPATRRAVAWTPSRSTRPRTGAR